MSHGASPLAAFHLIGDRSGLDPESAGKRGLRPALYGRYVDLSRLRYDYPLVLLTESPDGAWVTSLTDLFDNLLREVAVPGAQGETMRRQVLGLEQAIRTLVAGGQQGSLSLFWEAARRALVGTEGPPAAGTPAAELEANLRRARAALAADGEVVDCDRNLAPSLLARAWAEGERGKAERLRKRIVRLQQKLSDILEVDDLNSPAARSAARLEGAMGSADRNVFDFDEMSRLLRSAPTADRLPASRKKRIEAALKVLREQRFVTAPATGPADSATTYRFRYVDCHQALAAFRERLPAMAELVKAISVAELETDNHYVAARHDRFFSNFDEDHLGPSDLAQFPAYLVCLESQGEEDLAVVFEVLRAGLPFKILAQPDDILGAVSIPGGQLSFGLQGQQAARMAMGLENVFVLQATTASLYRLREPLLRGLASDRPALFQVYGGSGYLEAAAATESRALPNFVYDPAAGPGLARRFSLHGNPQETADWPAHRLAFETGDHTPGSEQTAFTLVDFVAGDPRFSDGFACVPRSAWNNEMEPLDRFLDLSTAQRSARVPYVFLLDDDNIVHRAIVDERLVDAAGRCRDAWRSLQELAGIGNSLVDAALAKAREEWEAEKARLLAAAAASPATAAAAVAAPQAASQAPAAPQPQLASEAAPEAAPASDDPWIESIRCTTCNECTQINDRMFAYDADKRARIADPDAGTYRQLVEAAESCQVAIIHPGKPRNPDEPGLEELLKRAEPFL